MNSIETIQILNYLFSLSAGSEGYRPSAAGVALRQGSQQR